MRSQLANQSDSGALSRLRLWQVLAIALVARILWAWLVPIHPLSDAKAYDELARQLADGHGYRWADGRPTAYWPVGTSALYALLYAVFGRSFALIAALNALLGTAFVAITFALARTRFDSRVAVLAALIIACWPTWIAFTTVISSELPTNVLFVAGLACAMWPRALFLVRTILSTTLLVCATYVRANMLPFILLVPVVVAFTQGEPKRMVKDGIIAALVAVLLITPWALRNQRAVGAAVPTSTNFGVNLWIGNNPEATGGYTDPPRTSVPDGEVEQDRFYRTQAVNFISSHPGRYLILCAKRVQIALDRETYGVAWNEGGLPFASRAPLKLVMTIYWYALLLSGIVGLVLFVRRRRANLYSPFVLLPLATMAAPVLVMATERYHYTLAPFVAIFAAYALIRPRDMADSDKPAGMTPPALSPS